MANKSVVFTAMSMKGTWGLVRCELWHSNVLFCIGSRLDMKENALEMIHKVSNGLSDEWQNRACSYVCNWINDHGLESDTDGDAFGFDGTGFIRMDNFTLGKLDDIVVLSHECLHVANAILRYVGLREDDNIEGLCYTHEYIFSNILKQLMNAGDMPRLGTKGK